MGLGAPEFMIILVFLLPFVCAIVAYRLAKKKGYGQLVAAATVAVTLVLAYFFPPLSLVPLVFFVLAPSKVIVVPQPAEAPAPQPTAPKAPASQEYQPPTFDPFLSQSEVASMNAEEKEDPSEPEATAEE